MNEYRLRINLAFQSRFVIEMTRLSRSSFGKVILDVQSQVFTFMKKSNKKLDPRAARHQSLNTHRNCSKDFWVEPCCLMSRLYWCLHLQENVKHLFF